MTDAIGAMTATGAMGVMTAMGAMGAFSIQSVGYVATDQPVYATNVGNPASR